MVTFAEFAFEAMSPENKAANLRARLQCSNLAKDPDRKLTGRLPIIR